MWIFTNFKINFFSFKFNVLFLNLKQDLDLETQSYSDPCGLDP
jgi:hypothetical protein